ncbi:transposase [Wolbachia endosymbiont (group B) of Ennomos erosarius]|uniref:transposase n=1 Tax=Wolbachia endosymbiont (group B) of Ennomos erosarius TaxID=3066175 RepID=UPI003133389C
MVNLICFFITAEFTLFSCLFYSPLIQNSRLKQCNQYGIKTKIPPKNNAAEHPKLDYMLDRNAAIQLMKLHGENGIKRWKEEVNYGKRSYIEEFFSRLKRIFGFSFKNKSETNREKELLIKCYLMNKFTAIGMPKFEIVA